MARWTDWYAEARGGVKSRLDCRDLARAYGLQAPRGGDRVTGKCPFHEDASPSFGARRERWTCFAGCGHGDGLDLIALATGLSGRDLLMHAADLVGWDWDAALEAWCKRQGMRVPKKVDRAPVAPITLRPDEPDPMQVLWDERGLSAPCVRRAARVALADVIEARKGEFDAEGRAWIEARGLDPEMCAWMRMASVSANPFGQWAREHADHEFWGFTTKRGGELPWWQHGLVVPYCNADGELECVRFRRVENGDGPKMISQRTVVRDLDWSPPLPYMGWIAPQAAQDRDMPLWVVEGEWDALALMMVDRLAVGSPGASAWREPWVEGWDKLSRVVICHDNDDAGRKWARGVYAAALKVHGVHLVTHRVKITTTPNHKDIGDVLREGAKGLRAWCSKEEGI